MSELGRRGFLGALGALTAKKGIRTRPPYASDETLFGAECPKCEGITMMRHFFTTQKEIEVDECPNCAGIWLDGGELLMIRQQFKTEAEREEAGEARISELFDDQLTAMAQESREKAEQAQRFAKMFRFVCPSAYIPGKQQGGAF